MAIFCVVVSMYLVQAVISFANKPEIPSLTIQMGSVDFPVVNNGVIIRNETVYTSPVSGVISYYYNDLERVRKDDVVCLVTNELEYKLQNELSKINTDILSLQERRGNMSAFDQDVVAYNDKIKEYIDNRVYSGISEGISNIYALKENISQNIAIRNQMLLSENRGSVQNLYDQKKIFENELNQNMTNIRVSASGILSYSVDGLETVFNFDSMNDLAEGQVKAQGISRRNSNENIIQQSEEVFKIVESNEWYVAAYLPLDEVFDWKENMQKTIYIESDNGYVMHETVVEKISKSTNDAYVLFRSSKNLLEYINTRSVRFKVNDSEHKGYKIPSTAIVDKTFLKIPAGYIIETDMYYVIKRTFDRDIQVSVSVFNKGDDYYLVSQNFNTLNLGDTIVKEDTAESEYIISEVENAKGLYVINNGYAEFRKINLNPAIPEKSPYTILNPNNNKNIKIFDRIISDARNIVDGQKIY